ncbi:uncharacterized protein FOMMEDRAFT_158753 [Fomitiporia mediterranea MF3/22]|uniref:uncharacterized protein n=1 Tax=Fomitiporia mediterranea (strain MF3/22) TaxID=694068 RepID=UPI0004407BA6|nr:uncharacterized protein FOMMEDRAFT_158753 [Fomitiporia mediterranea MF3/22]EJD01602.1 hypothetical protein FOMMEDRAFT_158753 [Fomitiporia mediterranea MF3/22]
MVQLAGQTRDYPSNSPPSALHGWLRRLRGLLTFNSSVLHEGKDEIHDARIWRAYRRSVRRRIRGPLPEERRKKRVGEREESPYRPNDIERYYRTPFERVLGIHHIHQHNRPEPPRPETRTPQFEPYNTLKAHYRHRQIGTLGDRILYTPRSQPDPPPPKPEPGRVIPATTPLVIIPGSSKVKKKYTYGYYT